MPTRTSSTGSELFIVDNSDQDWKVLRYLHDWCQISSAIDIATGCFEIGSLLGLQDEWQKVNRIRILMGDEVSKRTRQAFEQGLKSIRDRLDASLETEKERNDFLAGVPAIAEAIRSGAIQCRVYRKEKFHAKAYITHARMEVVGASALVGSSNFTLPGLTDNVELNVQITGAPVTVLQEWYEEHWNDAEDVTLEILTTIQRHTREYSPFKVYAKALQEYFRGYEMSADEWELAGAALGGSHMYPVLDPYQREGYHALMKIAKRYGGAFLCDGVGLGKTYVGLMLIERLIVHDHKRVALFVPLGARDPVWERDLRRHLPHLSGGDLNDLTIFNHTDLLRTGEYPARLARVKERADVIIVDEAHHFRNPGVKGQEGEFRTRYWNLYNIAEGKAVFLLTATPINNRLTDLQHMIELFSRHQAGYFKDAPLGIHSLPGHFRKLEKALEASLEASRIDSDGGLLTDQAEAEQVLWSDDLFRALVEQRSRAYVRRSQEQHGGRKVVFPKRQDPQVVDYHLRKTYGRVLDLVEQAFAKDKPLFSLAIYHPLAYYIGPDTDMKEKAWKEGREKQVVGLIRTQFLKRFESSTRAFQFSCEALLLKLLTWVAANVSTEAEKQRLDQWKSRHSRLIDRVRSDQHELLGEESVEESDEDVIGEEMLEEIDVLSRKEYKVEDILEETYGDLEQLAQFLTELEKFRPAHDDKLQALIKLLKSDPVLKMHKVLIFSEYMATTRYLHKQLREAGLSDIDEVDSSTKRSRSHVIRAFAPYYNCPPDEEPLAGIDRETRILISTDVLSEGLNLQDCTRLINYDLHWNPVRLMQRIGRVDRRLDPDVEARIVTDHPERKELRGTVAYWNFLPPEELDSLLRLYAIVSRKTLRISKVFGIEGKKLLRPEDDYEALKDFDQVYDGSPTEREAMHLEYQKLLQDNPGLEEELRGLPRGVFSSKQHPSPGSRAVFFCYALPAPAVQDRESAGKEPGRWTEEAGFTRWYLYDLATEEIYEDPDRIVALIRSRPDTPRQHVMPDETLSNIRKLLDKHIKNTYLKQVQAPVGVKPILKAWMELT